MQKPEKKSDKKIVVIGGGTGVFTVMLGLKKHFRDLTAVVTMADDGGSTGILREEFGILPPGDIRRILIALSPADQGLLSELFNYRFQEGGLAGHSFGNLMITALERLTGSFERAVEEAGKILSVQGKVLPVTLKPPRLLAEMEDGRIIKGESSLDTFKPEIWTVVKKVWLEPRVPINPRAKEAILKADCVILSPGDFYTSLIPNLIVDGMKEALRKTKATIIYFVNLVTKYSETSGFKASDFLKAIEKYLGNGAIDFAIINKTKPSLARLKPYIAQKAELVQIDLEDFRAKPIPIVTDLLKSSGLIRHDPEKIAKVVKMLI